MWHVEEPDPQRVVAAERLLTHGYGLCGGGGGRYERTTLRADPQWRSTQCPRCAPMPRAWHNHPDIALRGVAGRT